MYELAALISGDWRQVPPNDDRALIDRFWAAWRRQAMADGAGHEGVSLTQARVLRLACYPQHLLCELTGHDGEARVAAAMLYGPGGITVFDGLSLRLHDLNEKGHLVLADEIAARDYLRLFVSEVHGPEGRFQLVEDPIELMALGVDIGPALQSKPGPLVLQRMAEGSAGAGWAASCSLRYGNMLFAADFTITGDGLVEMTNDDPIGVPLPVGAERFEAPFRGALAAAEESE